jgi:ribosomal protein S18 acetylase RimI-like enzyme
MPDVRIWRLGPGDEDALRTIRLEALDDDPDAFGSTYEREVDRTTEEWQRWFTNGATFIAEDADKGAVGLAAGFLDFGGKPIAHVVSMWVRASHRGTGVADELLQAVLAWAATQDIEAVRLMVAGGNIRASKLYERHDFYPTGNTSIRERDGAVEVEMQRD